MTIANSAYTLWLRRGAPSPVDLSELEKIESAEDILAGLWNAYGIPPERLSSFEEHLAQALT